ncbi:hypothetical protein TrCOL_g13604 [Triparma columacea]|uniref:Protein translocase subunit SecA n=1 Tax=Triparma columacea TaxID=722753 RepID=A0A9W7LDS2_9STRA|nr:hypothetical protein TrCOL_g13604 [Triparma columacea]
MIRSAVLYILLIGNAHTFLIPSFAPKPICKLPTKPLFSATVSSEDTLFQYAEDAAVKSLSSVVSEINSIEAKVEEMDDYALSQLTQTLTAKPNTPLAFAAVREASWRVLTQRHYDCQLVGGLLMDANKLCEMQTGEGKTLTTLLPVYNKVVSGKKCFIVTTNDYLARRDSLVNGQVLNFLGVTTGLIQGGMAEDERRKQYDNDVVWVSNQEIGFDYLRDHLSMTKEGVVLGDDWVERFCLVDEADSIFIDEARTPLIISESVDADGTKFANAKILADNLQPKLHYDVDVKKKNAVLTEQGFMDAEKALGVDSLFEVKDGGSWVQYVTSAVMAKELFKPDVDYAIGPDSISIIDSFSGRVLEGRKYKDGLHQAIEAKEGITVSKQSRVVAKVTYQAFFGMFKDLSAMTGTAKTSEVELKDVYNIEVVRVPTALPVARRDYKDVVFKTRRAADEALAKEVVAAGGRPVLVGTTSVEQSERIVARLQEEGIVAELLNADAKNAPRESEIVAQAGRVGRVTVATNMAGRGTDIKLGGDAGIMAQIYLRSKLVEAKVLVDGEEAFLPATPAEGYFPVDVSEFDGEIGKVAKDLKKMGLTADSLTQILSVACDATEGEDDEAYVTAVREIFESVEGKFKDVLGEEAEEVKRLGGLYVMGTNRHESPRIDRQLRGRAGRQGDPGSSRFFLSFEDDMFKVFGGDKLTKMLEVFRVSEDMPIEAESVTKTLDDVQLKVEENYREIRDNVRTFDEVLNGQRLVIYQRRMRMLGRGGEFGDLVSEMAEEVVNDIIAGAGKGGKEVGKIAELLVQFFPQLSGVVGEGELGKYKGKGKEMGEFLKIAVGEAVEAKKGTTKEFEKKAQYLTLLALDNAWSQHLNNMESLVESVTLRGYRGLDPKIEYQQDGFELFKGLEGTIRRNAVYSLMNQ